MCQVGRARALSEQSSAWGGRRSIFNPVVRVCGKHRSQCEGVGRVLQTRGSPGQKQPPLTLPFLLVPGTPPATPYGGLHVISRHVTRPYAKAGVWDVRTSSVVVMRGCETLVLLRHSDVCSSLSPHTALPYAQGCTHNIFAIATGATDSTGRPGYIENRGESRSRCVVPAGHDAWKQPNAFTALQHPEPAPRASIRRQGWIAAEDTVTTGARPERGGGRKCWSNRGRGG